MPSGNGNDRCNHMALYFHLIRPYQRSSPVLSWVKVSGTQMKAKFLGWPLTLLFHHPTAHGNWRQMQRPVEIKLMKACIWTMVGTLKHVETNHRNKATGSGRIQGTSWDRTPLHTAFIAFRTQCVLEQSSHWFFSYITCTSCIHPCSTPRPSSSSKGCENTRRPQQWLQSQLARPVIGWRAAKS